MQSLKAGATRTSTPKSSSTTSAVPTRHTSIMQVPANAQLPVHHSTASGAQATCSSSSMTVRRQHARAAALPQAAVAPGSTAEPSTSQSVDWFATDKRPVILFDGVCNLCNGGVNFMLDWDKQGVYRLAALQSNPGRQLLMRCGRSPDDISSIVLVEEGGHYTKSDAVLRIAMRLGLPLPVVAAALMPLPHFIRDTFYDQVANNRYSFFGKTNACRVSADGFQDRFLGA